MVLVYWPKTVWLRLWWRETPILEIPLSVFPSTYGFQFRSARAGWWVFYHSSASSNYFLFRFCWLCHLWFFLPLGFLQIRPWKKFLWFFFLCVPQLAWFLIWVWDDLCHGCFVSGVFIFRRTFCGFCCTDCSILFNSDC